MVLYIFNFRSYPNSGPKFPLKPLQKLSDSLLLDAIVDIVRLSRWRDMESKVKA